MLRPYTADDRLRSVVRDLRWETRLLALVAAILVVFGLTAVYGASSLLTISGGQVGSSFALKQAVGAAVAGIVATLLARADSRRWQRWAWPVLAVAALLAGVVLFTAGARIGHFLALTLAATPLLFGAVASAQYRLARVITFLNPGSAPSEATWQVHQSLVGIGAGRLFGVGLGQGQQK